MARFSTLSLARLLLSATGALATIKVDVNDADSIKSAAALVAEDLMSLYDGAIPGILPGPPPDGDYYWWTGGALWAAMLDYRSRTGDARYDDKIAEGLLFQRGPHDDYLTPNWTATAGNDDQAVWGLAALLAAETGFAAPKGVDGSDGLQWADLPQHVFDEQQSKDRRVENGTCAGALRWQIYQINAGYNYISTFANLAYANLGARLSLLGGNKTQAAAVEDAFNLLQTKEFIDGNFNVFDGAQVPDCDQINKVQFSNVAALAVEGAAVMFNTTGGDEKWQKLLDGLLGRTIDVFFPDGVAEEVACESNGQCNTDMTFFKSFLHRSLATTVRVAPHTASIILPVLKTSAAAAVESCVGGDNGRMCGFVWSGDGDNETGAGSQMSVLSALVSLLPAGTVQGTPGTGNSSTPSSSSAGPSNTSGGSSEPSSTPPGSAGTHTGVNAVVLLGGLLLASSGLHRA